MIPYGRQDIDEADIEAVLGVLRSPFLTQGPAVPEFEQAVADHCGAAAGVAFSSATSALHAACLALGVGPGDRVWTSPITFVASANCALYCGAQVDFVDIDSDTFTMSVHALEARLEDAARSGRLPKVVVPVHMCGQSADMRGIHALAQRYGFSIIEDASHAVGATYDGRPVGDCRFSDITVFSFHPVKIVTSGEGGMAVTGDPALAARMQLLRSHGITRDPCLMTREPEGPWYYQQVALGYNFRMTDLQAALGRSQMRRLGDFVARRREIAATYRREFADIDAILQPFEAGDRQSSWHLYVVRLARRPELRKALFEALRDAGLGVQVHYIPVHLQPYYSDLGFAPGDFPVAEDYYSRAISLPLFPAMTSDEVERVVAAVRTQVGALL